MPTVVSPVGLVRTVIEHGLIPFTLHIVQPYWLGFETVRETSDEGLSTSRGESQLSAGHLSICCTKEVVTHCAPDVVVADLKSASHVVGTTSEPDVKLSTSWGRMGGREN